MRNVALAAFAAGLVLAGMSGAFAGERPGKQFTSYTPRPSQAAQSSANVGNVERRCITQSCGSVWCYTVRR